MMINCHSLYSSLDVLPSLQRLTLICRIIKTATFKMIFFPYFLQKLNLTISDICILSNENGFVKNPKNER